MQNDFSKLRPFDLEAAKAGEKLINTGNGDTSEYIAGPDAKNAIIVRNDCDGVFYGSTYYHEHYRMAPLAWVEGKPVYRGDVLFSHTFHDKHPKGLLITGKHPNDCLSWKSIGNGRTSIDGYGFSEFTWNPPKVKREGWINIYPSTTVVGGFVGASGNIYQTEAMALAASRGHANVTIRIEWESPA